MSEKQTAIVTGAATGIGKATAQRLAGAGHDVAIFDIDEERGGEVARCLGGAALFARCDVRDAASVKAGVEQTLGRFGHIDVLINNAGRNAYHDAVAMTEDEWDEILAVDFKGAWLCAREVLPGMRERKRGSIVNIASIHSQCTIEKMFPYAACKSGLVGMTRSLALDEAVHGIRVNTVSPGWTRTEMVQEWFEHQDDPKAAERSVLDLHPLKRIATPDEIAAVVAFVASDDASFVTGAEVRVDGGLSVRMPT